MLLTKKNIETITNFDILPLSVAWCDDSRERSKIHKIHAYPAKFPSFMIKKAVNYARNCGIDVTNVADIFCGCGTAALEAKRIGLDFWGCDINPVATLIARVKSGSYNTFLIEKYAKNIFGKYQKSKIKVSKEYKNNERINYWFSQDKIIDLYRLLFVIKRNVPKGKYRDFFLCAFSNILKLVSKWLTKSIKPQIDPRKKSVNVGEVYQKQVRFMLNAFLEENVFDSRPDIKIINRNFLRTKCNRYFLDMIITSPPYVTSYEYADLHQLSTLWLGYCFDYRSLRAGTIGSLYHSDIPRKPEEYLNKIGLNILRQLKKIGFSRANSIAKYFIDMEKTVKKSFSLVKNGGMVFFVIGNTKYKGVNVDNAKYLSLCMLEAGFKRVRVEKRRINSKTLTPYRSKDGKFSNNKKHRKIYNQEFVLIGKK